MILCTGESLIDMVPQEGLLRPLPGGSVFNTAVALGRLGTRTAYLWPISRDGFGAQILERLTEAGVDTSLCPRTDRLTTLAMVSLTAGEARYSFYDEGSAGRLFATADIPPLPDAMTALLSGGISLVPDPCGATIEALIAAHHRRLPVMLDPNIRPFFISDPTAYRGRLTRLLAMASIVKMSADDLNWLHPDLAPEAAARRVLAEGADLVLLTGGEAGARALWQDRTVEVPAVRIRVADTIGAGDTFNAGVLASLGAQGVLSRSGIAALTSDQVNKALVFGAQAAAITVSRPGADPPWAHEMPG